MDTHPNGKKSIISNLLLQIKIVSIHTIMLQTRLYQHILLKGRRGRDHIVVGLTTNPVISVTMIMSQNSGHGEVYSIQEYVIKLVSDMPQLGSFLWILRIPPSIKLIAGIQLKYFESGVKHRIPKPYLTVYLIQMIKFYLRFCF